MADNFTQLVTGITLGRAALVQSLVQAPANAADGSAAAPGLSFSGDQTTGIARIGGVPQVVQSGTAVQTLGERVSLSAYKLAGDPDWSAAFQRAHDYLTARNGGVVLMPAGQLTVGAATVNITGCVMFEGQGWNETSALLGTTIYTANTANRLFSVSGLAATGVGFRRCAFAQAHPAPGTGWAPTVYPWVLDVENTKGSFILEDVFLYGIYEFANFNDAERITIRGLKGQPFSVGILIDQSYDRSFVSDLHFWPFWSQDSNVVAWTQANGTGIWLKRVDGFQAPAVFMFGYMAGIRCSNGGYGTVNLAQIGSFYPDACQYGLWLDSTSLGATLHLGDMYTGGETLAGTHIPNATAIQFDSSGAFVKVSNLKALYEDMSAIAFSAAAGGNSLMISNAEFNGYNTEPASPYQPAIVSPATATTTPNYVSLGAPPVISNNNNGPLTNECSLILVTLGGTPAYVVAPASGSTVVTFPSTPLIIIEPTAALSSLTISLPYEYAPNCALSIWLSQSVETLTFTSQTGPAGLPAPPVIHTTYAPAAAGQCIKALFLGTTTGQGGPAWFLS